MLLLHSVVPGTAVRSRSVPAAVCAAESSSGLHGLLLSWVFLQHPTFPVPAPLSSREYFAKRFLALDHRVLRSCPAAAAGVGALLRPPKAEWSWGSSHPWPGRRQKVEGQSVQELMLQRGPRATRQLGKPQRCWIACILWKDVLQ